MVECFPYFLSHPESLSSPEIVIEILCWKKKVLISDPQYDWEHDKAGRSQKYKYGEYVAITGANRVNAS